MQHTDRKSLFARIAVVVTVASALSTADAASINPPSGSLTLETVASGVQIYACEYDKDHRLSWTFKSPRATLYDTNGRAVIEHSAGPTWAANDGSRIVGELVAQVPSEAPDSVPQLLLRAKSVGGSGLLAGITYVQRVKTQGGVKPVAACTEAHQIGDSPYLAVYRFYQ